MSKKTMVDPFVDAAESEPEEPTVPVVKHEKPKKYVLAFHGEGVIKVSGVGKFTRDGVEGTDGVFHAGVHELPLPDRLVCEFKNNIYGLQVKEVTDYVNE